VKSERLKMAIYKAVVENNYAVIPNETLQDQSLTFEARGILCLLLSLPADWEIHKSWLQKQAPSCGRDKLTRILGELQKAGYLRRQSRQGESGKMDGVDWYVYPTAQLENRMTENPSCGKPATTKETVLQSKNNTNLGAPTGDAQNRTQDQEFIQYQEEQPAEEAKQALDLEAETEQTPLTDQPSGLAQTPVLNSKTTNVRATDKPVKMTKAQKLVQKVLSSDALPALSGIEHGLLEEWARLRCRKGASDSDRALATIESTLVRLAQNGVSPEQAIAAQCDSGWATIKFEYLIKGGQHGKTLTIADVARSDNWDGNLGEF
jgi:hypothetical protein